VAAGYFSFEAFWIGGAGSSVVETQPPQTGGIQFVVPQAPRRKAARSYSELPFRSQRRNDVPDETKEPDLAAQIRQEDHEIGSIIIAILECL
jgi:hypothetical protein